MYTWKQLDEVFEPEVDKDPEAVRQCRYFDYEAGTEKRTGGHCAVGVIFHKLGIGIPVDKEDDLAGRGPGISGVFERDYGLFNQFDRQARRYLIDLQTQQDGGHSWSDSRAYALQGLTDE